MDRIPTESGMGYAITKVKKDNNYTIQKFMDQYDDKTARTVLDILLKNKVNEIKQIGEDIGCLSTDYTNNDWQDDIIRFCLDVDGCFEGLSEVAIADEQIHKCTNIMQAISKHKTLNEAQKLQWLAYNIAQDFKLLYAQEKEGY